MKSCRAEFDQQEMDYYVGSVFVWFVKHAPVGNNTARS